MYAARFQFSLCLPSSSAMAVVSSATIHLWRKSRFRTATRGVMMITRLCGFLTRRRVHVLATKLLATFPTPRAPTACSRRECTRTRLKSTGKNVITGGIFQTPTLAPRALFRICATTFFFRHSFL